tara:strand:- start:360 stop:533 length:174 start_codon:yes stop_codon:yes gene_type:complete
MPTMREENNLTVDNQHLELVQGSFQMICTTDLSLAKLKKKKPIMKYAIKMVLISIMS